jgi:hypothetical protein
MQYGHGYRNQWAKEVDVNRRVLGVLSGLVSAGLATAAVVTACSTDRTSSSGGAGTPSVGTSSSAGASATVSGGPATATPTTSSQAPPVGSQSPGPATTPGCAAADLALAQLPGGEGASGTVLVSIGLTNRSGRACSINGYPAFTLAGSAGDQPVAIEHDGLGMPTFQMAPSPVTVNPSGRAGFMLAYLNRPSSESGSCTTATKMALRIGAAVVTGPVQISLCGEPLKVSPYVPADRLTTA